jgi:hypothetical protein
LFKYFNLKEHNDLNYFSITTLLFYIKDIGRYKEVHEILLEKIRDKFKNGNQDNLSKKTELILLLFDILSCPFVKLDFKKELLSLYELDSAIQEQIINYSLKTQKYWFTKWTDFNYKRELETKSSGEVYS